MVASMNIRHQLADTNIALDEMEKLDLKRVSSEIHL